MKPREILDWVEVSDGSVRIVADSHEEAEAALSAVKEYRKNLVNSAIYSTLLNKLGRPAERPALPSDLLKMLRDRLPQLSIARERTGLLDGLGNEIDFAAVREFGIAIGYDERMIGRALNGLVRASSYGLAAGIVRDGPEDDPRLQRDKRTIYMPALEETYFNDQLAGVYDPKSRSMSLFEELLNEWYVSNPVAA